MAKYLNLDGLQTLWTKAKNTFAPKSHNHNASDINAGTLPIARGGTGATTTKSARQNILSDAQVDSSNVVDSNYFAFRYQTPSADNGVIYYRTADKVWNYIKSKLGISSAVGGTANPVYVDSNGQLKAVGGTMLKQGGFLDTHSEGSRTMWIDGTNELFAFYDRGGTCTAYEYDLEWSSSSPAPAGTFSPADLSSHKTTASVANISANVFNSLTGYNQSTVYSGTKYAVYDLKLPASFSYSTTFYWSFGCSGWKPHYFEVLVWKNNATQYPNGYISKYRSTSVGTYGSVAVGVGATEGNSFTHIRIVMDKYSRLAAFGIVNYSSTGLATNYMSRTVDKSLYRDITVAKNNTYNLGSSSAKWAEVFATNFNGALKGNADTASNCNYSGKADANTLVVKRTNAAGGAFIQYLPNNQTENWWRTGSVQDSSKFVFNYKGTDKAFIDTNGAYNGDVEGNASTASAAKSGSALETAINGKQDALPAQTAFAAKGSATKVPKITTNELGQVTDITEVDVEQPTIVQDLRVAYDNPTDVARAQSVVPSQYAVGYYTIEELKKIDDKKLDVEDAADTYLTKEEAGTSYLTRRYASDYYLTKEDAADTYLKQTDPSAGVTDWGDNEYKVLCGYKGGSIAEVAPGLNPGDPKSSGSEYLVSVFHNENTKTSYYKDVKASNVTVGKAIADGDGKEIAKTYLKTADAYKPIKLNAPGGYSCYASMPVITVIGSDVTDTTINARTIFGNSPALGTFAVTDVRFVIVLNRSGHTITLNTLEGNNTFSLPNNRHTMLVGWKTVTSQMVFREEV